MPSHVLWSEQSKGILPGHGKVGYIQLSLTVSPEMKDGLISVALANGTTVMAEARAAIDFYLADIRKRSAA